MKIKFNFIKFIITLFLIFLAIIGIHQLYVYLYKAADTEFAVQISCEETDKAVGYFVRNEEVIYSGNSKYYDIIIPDGGKVSKNGTIANVYSTESAAKIQSRIREVEQKINEYKSVSSAGNGANDSAAYVSDIKKNVIKIVDNVSTVSPTDAFEGASDFTVSVIKQKIANGEITDYSGAVDELKAELQQLKEQSTSVTKYFSAPVSGYFAYKTDGLETKLNMDISDNITAESFETIKSLCESKSPVADAIGKVVKGSDWRICFKSDADKYEKSGVGSVVYIRIPSLTDSKIKCTIVGLSKIDNDAYVVLQSNVVTGDILSQRNCEIEVVISSYNGLRVAKNALRKIDGKDGVFVKSNGIVRYKEVDLLYMGSTYAVVDYNPINKNDLQAYDEVVVKGSGLYDGKVIS